MLLLYSCVDWNIYNKVYIVIPTFIIKFRPVSILRKIYSVHVINIAASGTCGRKRNAYRKIWWKETASRNLTYCYTGCPRTNVPDFGRVILMLNYTDKTQKTYVQSRTVTEIIAREKCGLHRSLRTVRRPWRHTCPMRLPVNETL